MSQMSVRRFHVDTHEYLQDYLLDLYFPPLPQNSYTWTCPVHTCRLPTRRWCYGSFKSEFEDRIYGHCPHCNTHWVEIPDKNISGDSDIYLHLVRGKSIPQEHLKVFVDELDFYYLVISGPPRDSTPLPA